MNTNDYYGQLYEAFIESIIDNNPSLYTNTALNVVNADQMMNLIIAEQKGESQEQIAKLGQIVKEQLLIALQVLYEREEYEWKKKLLSNLVTETKQAFSSFHFIWILNQIIDIVYSGRLS